MDNAKLKRLMSRKGCSPDNAACEGFFSRLKKRELFYPRNWQATTIDQFIEQFTEQFTEQFIEVVDSYSAGTTKSASRSPLAHSVPTNTERASDLRHNQSKNSAAPPNLAFMRAKA